MAGRKQYPLRIDPALWAELEAWAADELRSVNGQIEYLLREAVAQRRAGGDAPARPATPRANAPPRQDTASPQDDELDR